MALKLSLRGRDPLEAVDICSRACGVTRCSVPLAPTVVVLDQRVPGLPGLSVARQVRRQGFAGPVVLHWACQSPDREAEAKEAGIRVAAKVSCGSRSAC